MNTMDVVVVGAGTAGLGTGYHLQRAGHTFVILERGRVGETWRAQRWDAFTLNTPNWSNCLPGDTYDGDQPDGFYHRDELVAYLDRYAQENELPIRSGVTVTSLDEHQNEFVVEAIDENGTVERIATRNVVVASGFMQTPRIPRVSEKFPAAVRQLHTADYRSPGALPEGAVVIVGGGQSGCQIADDLANAGREVYMCTSKVARLPRRHRGRDTLAWWREMGLWDLTVDQLSDPAMRFAAQPQVSGVGRYGSTLSLQHLARRGVHLMGRLRDVERGILTTDDSLAEHIAFADQRSAQFRADIDAYIEKEEITAPPSEPDPIDAPAGPEVAAGGGLDELRGNANPLAGAPNASFDNVAHTQILADVLHVGRATLVSE